MKRNHLFSFAIIPALLLGACKKEKSEVTSPSQSASEVIAEVKNSEQKAAKGADIPILRVSKGDTWIYKVKVQIPEGVSADGKAVENAVFERKRTFIGKVKPSSLLPETGCFEIEAKGYPIEREFVDIDDERVLMRGSATMGSAEIEPMWLEPGVLLVSAGLLGGESLPPVKINDPKSGAEVVRLIQIVGREKVRAVDHDFDTIRILMSGVDGRKAGANTGGIELRRTIWFAPHYGIVKEEKARYVNDRLVLKETVELKSMSMKIDQ